MILVNGILYVYNLDFHKSSMLEKKVPKNNTLSIWWFNQMVIYHDRIPKKSPTKLVGG